MPTGSEMSCTDPTVCTVKANDQLGGKVLGLVFLADVKYKVVESSPVIQANQQGYHDGSRQLPSTQFVLRTEQPPAGWTPIATSRLASVAKAGSIGCTQQVESLPDSET